METVDHVLKVAEKSEENNEANMQDIVTNNFSTPLLLQTAQILSEVRQTARNPTTGQHFKTRCALIPFQLWPEHTPPKPESLSSSPTDTDGPTKLSLHQVLNSQEGVLKECARVLVYHEARGSVLNTI